MALKEKKQENDVHVNAITSTKAVSISSPDADKVESDHHRGDIPSNTCTTHEIKSNINGKQEYEAKAKPVLRKDVSFLEVSMQIDQTAKIEVHTKEMVYHHVSSFCCNKCKCRCRGKEYEQQLYKKIDYFVLTWIYSLLHIFAFSLSTLVYVLFILVGWYQWHHALTSVVYMWFIFHQIALLLTANYRLFKLFLNSFAFWYKIINVAVGIFSRQLCFDGTRRFTTSPLHGLSGVLCIFTFIFANAIVGVIKSYCWPEITLFDCYGFKQRLRLNRYLKTVLILFMFILNGVQVFQLYFSDNDYVLVMFGYTISLRNTAMSAFNSANVWYLKQIYSDFMYPDMIMTNVPFEWVHDDSSYDIKDPRFSDLNLGRKKIKQMLNISGQK